MSDRELTNLKGVGETEYNLLLLSAGKFCLRHQEKEQKSKEEKNKSGLRKENLSILINTKEMRA